MDHDARLTLEALARGAHLELMGRERWVAAFKTIGWAIEGHDGPMLTAEGRRGCDELGRERRGRSAAGSAL